jgi:hypothetical protein
MTRVTFKDVQENLSNIQGYVRNVQKRLKSEPRYRISTLKNNFMTPTRPSTNLSRNRSTRRLRFSSVQEIVSKECDPVLEYIKGLSNYYDNILRNKSIIKIAQENKRAAHGKEVYIPHEEFKDATIPVLYKIRVNSATRLDPHVPLRTNENKRPASATARRTRVVGGTLRRHKKPKKTRKYKKRRTPRI